MANEQSLNVESDKAPTALFESLTLDSAAVSFPTARQTLFASQAPARCFRTIRMRTAN